MDIMDESSRSTFCAAAASACTIFNMCIFVYATGHALACCSIIVLVGRSKLVPHSIWKRDISVESNNSFIVIQFSYYFGKEEFPLVLLVSLSKV